MINNKGFTLIEVLSTLVLISIVVMVAFMSFRTTMSASKEETYKLMKNNILSVSYDYINECNLGTIECDFSFEEKNKFNAIELQNAGFFGDLESPIDGRNLGFCLVLEATKSNGVTVINLIDNCY
jgi:prepilin-type N-terminal cleavage/methylation domain-containing protein